MILFHSFHRPYTSSIPVPSRTMLYWQEVRKVLLFPHCGSMGKHYFINHETICNYSCWIEIVSQFGFLFSLIVLFKNTCTFTPKAPKYYTTNYLLLTISYRLMYSTQLTLNGNWSDGLKNDVRTSFNNKEWQHYWMVQIDAGSPSLC